MRKFPKLIISFKNTIHFRLTVRNFLFIYYYYYLFFHFYNYGADKMLRVISDI
jgi:hypothetical protein